MVWFLNSSFRLPSVSGGAAIELDRVGPEECARPSVMLSSLVCSRLPRVVLPCVDGSFYLPAI